ncbi:fumarylacetoacetate hydrolase family protein (plasmid) [Curtobacterium sp. MCLR17_007]|uniref:fumarylacetoacetate hydrolase family protein n=1 Tax=Curtobacterium sp. MCLR17_007 TaxID=2175648 RepID=UPI000DAA03D7|nr:fumarylacetoacetate hydrolase family protein [Curtobacterium sp. MCLR17_007]WIB62112.1 fumarylacetoacetate hydrolase family protein [Curtobacterium sp. MCLR17_007]
MKFARVGEAGNEVPVVFDDQGVARDLRGVTDEIDGAFLAANPVRAVGDVDRLPVLEGASDLRIGPPVARPGKVVCVGLNYRDHAAETGAQIPTEPIVFMKDPMTVVGPHDDVLVPRRSEKTDWEVELAIVIGRTARYCESRADAAACIAGYTIANDVSEREFQTERGGQWDKGKSCETFNPLGPWLVTADEVADPYGEPGAIRPLGMRLTVNGEVRQDGSTANMIFEPADIVHYLSQFMVLYPGDVIDTGTPAGVALGGGAPYLRAGDRVELSVDGLGTQAQTMVDA